MTDLTATIILSCPDTGNSAFIEINKSFTGRYELDAFLRFREFVGQLSDQGYKLVKYTITYN